MASLRPRRGRHSVIWVSVVAGRFYSGVFSQSNGFFLKAQGELGFTHYLCSALIASGNSVEAGFAGIVLGKLCRQAFISDQLRSVALFVIIASLACLLSALIGVLSLIVTGFLPSHLGATVFITWWVGDLVGVLVLTPPILWFFSVKAKETQWSHLVLALGVIALVSGLTFLAWGNFILFTSQAYLLLPALMLLGLRMGRVLSVGAMLIVSAFAIWGTLNGLGPFVRADSNVSLILLQGYVAVLVISLLMLDAINRERKMALDSLTKVNAELEERVRMRTEDLQVSNEELARSNRELDEFAYIASHDLKEPLRGIENQLSFLQEDYGHELSPEVKERLARLPPITKHLEALIQTLLEFSRVGRVDLHLTEVDLQVVVNDVLMSVQGRIESERVTVRRPMPLPKTLCDPARVGEIFRNLITNAIKYNDKEDRWLEIGYLIKNKETVFYVKDNGIGIPEKHHEKVFKIFKRLHGQNKFGGGTGAGMTICKKIVERHKGQIWIDSVVGVGTTFFFTLAASQHQEPL